MAWTVPFTFTVGQILTAAQMNTYVRDNTRYLKGLDGAVIFDSQIQPPSLQSALGRGGHPFGMDSGWPTSVDLTSVPGRYMMLGSTSGLNLLGNLYYDGTNYQRLSTGSPGSILAVDNVGGIAFHFTPAAANPATMTQRGAIYPSGGFFWGTSPSDPGAGAFRAAGFIQSDTLVQAKQLIVLTDPSASLQIYDRDTGAWAGHSFTVYMNTGLLRFWKGSDLVSISAAGGLRVGSTLDAGAGNINAAGSISAGGNLSASGSVSAASGGITGDLTVRGRQVQTTGNGANRHMETGTDSVSSVANGGTADFIYNFADTFSATPRVQFTVHATSVKSALIDHGLWTNGTSGVTATARNNSGSTTTITVYFDVEGPD